MVFHETMKPMEAMWTMKAMHLGLSRIGSMRFKAYFFH